MQGAIARGMMVRRERLGPHGAEHRAAEFEYDQRARNQPFATGGSRSTCDGGGEGLGSSKSTVLWEIPIIDVGFHKHLQQ
jgi:hypothetical protein